MGEKFGRYDILSTLGAGGMGMVYLAQDSMLGRQIALKVLDKALCSDEQAVKRFLHEARISASLNHPNITSVYDLGVTEQGSFIAMEYLTGESLRSIIARRPRLALWKKILIALQIAKGLEHAHRSNVIHRDVKPSNIQVLEGGVVKLMDFGIAKIVSADPTVLGRPIGTPGYSAPEQIREQPVTPASDVFSFGAVLYELLTYRPAFPGQDFPLLLYKIVYEPYDPFQPEDSGIPPQLVTLIDRSLQKKPEDRAQSFTPIVQELRALFRELKPDRPEDAQFDLSEEEPPPNRQVSAKAERTTGDASEKAPPKKAPFPLNKMDTGSIRVKKDSSDTGSIRVKKDSSDTGSIRVKKDSSDTGSIRVKKDGSDTGSIRVKKDGSDTGSIRVKKDGSDSGAIKARKDTTDKHRKSSPEKRKSSQPTPRKSSLLAILLIVFGLAVISTALLLLVLLR